MATHSDSGCRWGWECSKSRTKGRWPSSIH